MEEPLIGTTDVPEIPDGAPESVPFEGADPPDDMLAAFQEAQAQIGGREPAEDPAQSAPDTEPATGESSEGEGEAPPPSSEFDRRGYLAELIAKANSNQWHTMDEGEREALQTAREQWLNAYRQEQADRRDFQRTYRTYRTLEQEDPSAYAAALRENPGLFNFLQDWEKNNPGVADDPFADDGANVDAIRGEVVTEMQELLQSTMQGLAEVHGISQDDLPGIIKGASGYGDALDRIVRESVKRTLASERETIRAEERAAAEREAMAKNAPRRIVTPRQIDASAGVGIPADEWEAAAQEAELEIARRR